MYRALGTTKQNFHQKMNRYLRQEEEKATMVRVMHDVRENHPRMGARTMYMHIRPNSVGRINFRKVYNEAGFKLHQKKNHKRTTKSEGTEFFDNLIEGYELTGVNQVYVSDITYYKLSERFYYLTFIMDLYSRRIKGYRASKTMFTEDTTIPALKMALEGLDKEEADGLIFHSDGGGQYYSKEFQKITKEARLRNSMCKTVHENLHAERINGTIKNDYVNPYGPKNYKELQKDLKRAVKMYNDERPHHSLGMISPKKFEKQEMNY